MSTQNQALHAIDFLSRDVLRRELGRFDAIRARRPQRVPTVLSRPEIGMLLQAMAELPTKEPFALMAQLMYGAGLRLIECYRLRVKDIDLERGQI